MPAAACDDAGHFSTRCALTLTCLFLAEPTTTANPTLSLHDALPILDAAGNWTYSADDSQTAIQQLGAGQSITDSFTAVSSDGSASQLVTVTIKIGRAHV